jgi:hypothetical protein
VTGDPARLPAQLEGDMEQMNLDSFAVNVKKFCTGPTRAAKAEQKFLVREPARYAQQTNHGRIPESLSFVLFESPITSVSTDSRALYRKSDFCIPRNETA